MNINNHPDLGHPKTPWHYLRLYLTGFAMGCADIVPGVSGGTMAFISGIYETLINAIKSFDLNAIRLALRFDIKGFIEHTSLRFLITLMAGIGTAILLLSNIVHYLLENEPTFLFSFFAGLILASIVAIAFKVKWTTTRGIAFVVGAIVAFVIVGFSSGNEGDHSLPVLFISGAIAICAMILPGISGSFILLILGQYDYIITAIKDFDFPVIITVGLGIMVGIISFSHFLSWLLKHYEQVTIATLVGFMVGAMRMIWDEAVRGVEIVSDTGQLSGMQVVLIMMLIVIGFLLVSFIDHLQSRSNPILVWFWPPVSLTESVDYHETEKIGDTAEALS